MVSPVAITQAKRELREQPQSSTPAAQRTVYERICHVLNINQIQLIALAAALIGPKSAEKVISEGGCDATKYVRFRMLLAENLEYI